MPFPTLSAPSELRQEFKELKSKLSAILKGASEVRALLDADELSRAKDMAAALGDLAIEFGSALDASSRTERHAGDAALNECERTARTFAQALCNPDDAMRLSMPETLAGLTAWSRRALQAWGKERLNIYRRRTLTAVLLAVACLAGIYAAADHVAALHSRKIERERASHFDVDLARPGHNLPSHFKVGGLLLPESDGSHHWCWGLGPKTLIAFVLQEPRQITVSGTLHNPIAGQIVTFNGNGTLRTYTLDRTHTWPQADFEFTFTFTGEPGLNTLSIEYGDWNHKSNSFAPNDPNQYAVAYQKLLLSTQKTDK